MAGLKVHKMAECGIVITSFALFVQPTFPLGGKNIAIILAHACQCL